jgi:hypothetical protein
MVKAEHGQRVDKHLLLTRLGPAGGDAVRS